MNRNKSLARQATVYEPLFWANQGNTKLVPLTQRQIKGLEREMTLHKQFINNSANNKTIKKVLL
ncbi:MAG: hypothetical protein AAGA02_04775 [Bacteroidota bacterium]